jgi:pyroglutamyl-peptidase
MSTILLTGYGPFGDHETNPSARVARALDGETIAGASVVGRAIPVVFDEALPRVRALIDDHDPAAVVSTGLMPERSVLTVERVGINVRDCDDVPDNDGQTPTDDPVHADGPDAYFATLPVKRLVAASRDAGVPARVSNTAGTHLCNNVLYAVRHHVATTDRDVRSGFVHVPFSHEQAARRTEPVPSMATAAMETGLEAMIAALAAES